MDYGYPAERFAAARQAFMQSAADDGHEAVVSAFLECRLGLHRLYRSRLDEHTRSLIYTLECFMDTEGVAASGNDSAWAVKAKGLTTADKAHIRRVVDELAQFFASQDT